MQHTLCIDSPYFSPSPFPECLPAGVSATDRTMKAQLVGELRNLLEQKVGAAGLAGVAALRHALPVVLPVLLLEACCTTIILCCPSSNHRLAVPPTRTT